ncbi:uncharacterized protein Dvar_61680 [Desulfosarcina variabilis str. Montpellier]
MYKSYLFKLHAPLPMKTAPEQQVSTRFHFFGRPQNGILCIYHEIDRLQNAEKNPTIRL